MNAFVKKEARLLLPTFLVGLTAALAMWWPPRSSSAMDFWGGLRTALPFIVCPALLVMIALDSFGREVSAGTFSQLLGQPIPRARIWWTKISLLAGAMLLILAVWLVGFGVVGKIAGERLTPSDWRDTAIISILFTFLAFSGGLWTVLFFRQVATAFWFTLLTPAALLVTAANLLDSYTLQRLVEGHPTRTNVIMIGLLILYGVAGFLFAWRLFLRAQDIQRIGGNITLPKWLSLARLPAGAGSRRQFRPRAAMLSREFQLHQSQLIIAGGLAVLHLGAILVRSFKVGFSPNGTVDFILHQFWFLWLVMPLLVGCAAVAEERKLGTLEGQLCLPAKRRTQFAMKLLVVLLLSTLLGAVMPLLLEGLTGDTTAIWFDEFRRNMNNFLSGLTMWNPLPIWLVLFRDILLNRVEFFTLAGFSIAASLIAFYTSTLSRNTLQALGPTMLSLVVVILASAVGFTPEDLVGYPLWRGFLVHLIGVPVLALVVGALAWWNYRRVQTGWPMWRRNLLTLVAALALVMTGTTAIYHRAWELVMPLEPEHGPARLTISPSLTLEHHYGVVGVGLPDGRFWSGYFASSIRSLTAMLTSDWGFKAIPGGSRFLEGTNWVSVANGFLDTVAIQKDGSLWVSEKPMDREFYRFFGKHQPPPMELTPLVRVGDDHDWSSVVGGYANATLLKRDGTLWTWKTGQFKSPNLWPGLRAFKLEQVGTDTNWAKLYQLSGWTCLRKTDGRVWYKSFSSLTESDDVFVTGSLKVSRAAFMDNQDWRGAAWVQVSKGVMGGFMVGVRDDGTFRLMAKWPAPGKMERSLVKQDLQFGQETNWLAVVGNGGSYVTTLKADGTLWRWTFADDPQAHPEFATATRIGSHSDWVAIAGSYAGFTSLAADGSLWYWRADTSYRQVSGEIPGAAGLLIGASRKPQPLANIFAETK